MFSAASLRSLELGGNEAQLKTWLEAMNTQAKRASEVVRHLRRFVRKGDIHPGPVDLNQAAREVAGLMRFEVARHKVEIELDLAEGMPTLSAELILMEQVLFNLVRNALEALVRQDGEKRVTVRTRHDETQVRVEVEDNGPGVDAALGDRIFESFMTGKRDGLGMGLAISRSIVEAHGGTLDYLNNPLGGATFRCCLPRETKHV
jgi:C4-dicarboxylate-specific signal transduction histidine kinase